MKKEIKLCLVYRDMWQSSGKYMPRVDQLVRVAQPIIDMGCFSRVETNGGGFEQICLLYGENPNKAVREWTQPFNDAGIQTQMLERGLNGIRMSPVGADVRQLMFKVKKKQGTDIARSFDGLNNPQNLALSFQYAHEGGMVAQGALSITHSPLHTVDYYIKLADQYIELGAEEICIKDMAGVGRPVSIGKMVKGIKERHPNILVQYHGHSTPGFSVTSSLEAARAGADIIDVGMEPLSWGTGHADLLTIHAMLIDAGFSVPDVNTEAYMATRSMTQEFIDDFLGYYINPQNRFMSSLLIGPGLPGGMMGSLMADLEKNLEGLNKWLVKNGRDAMTQEQLLLKLFDEVEYAWPKLGYPPLVTPFSQYVKNVALMNAIQLIKGKERWSMIDENTWGMLLGRSGQLLGELGDDIKNLAAAQDREFYTGNPQDLYPNALPDYRQKMKEKGWDTGTDDEELLEYAMHPGQYEAFKSGAAKARFQEDLAKRKAGTSAAKSTPTPPPVANAQPKEMTITVDGKAYRVAVDYGTTKDNTPAVNQGSPPSAPRPTPAHSTLKSIVAPLEGKFLLTKDSSEKPISVGDVLNIGDTVAYIESMKVINAITADQAGVVVEIVGRHGEDIEEDEVIVRLN
ncbi:biotin/lipoyl-containing protein [Lewinella sp. LCG006]|uniref:biotin/lipoyl-containing protein n=1 Tax=Lewinella sp. LCG006 TaxID=3231911 RepID=UPI003460D6AA